MCNCEGIILCVTVNFLMFSAYVYLSTLLPPSEAAGLKRLIWLKYYFVLKWKDTFNLGLNAAKNTHHIKKRFKQKLFGIEFRTKKSASVYVYPLRVELVARKIDMVEILFCTEPAKYIQFRTQCCQKYGSNQKKL